MKRLAKARTAAPTMRRPRGLGRNRIAFVSLFALLACAGIGASSAVAAPVAGDPCPNGDIRKQQGTSSLPDCMAMEMVSPALKFQQAARVFQPVLEGGLRNTYTGAISLTEDRILFSALTSLDDAAFTRVSGEPYVAVRNGAEDAWRTVRTDAGGGRFYGILNSPRARSFDANLDRWFHIAVTEPEYKRGELQIVSGSVAGANKEVTPLLLPLDPLGQRPYDVPDDAFDKGSSGDRSKFYFSPGRDVSLGGGPTRYLAGDPRPSGTDSISNTYIAHSADSPQVIELLARDGVGKVWGGNCGATIAGSANNTRGASRGAISHDGSRVYFLTRPGQPFDSVTGEGPACSSTANKVRIMVRSEGVGGPSIAPLFESECDRIADPGPPEVLACGKTMTGAAPPAGGNTVPDGDDTYQGGSVDGDRVYFTSSRQLADSDVNGLEGLGLSGCVGSLGIGVGGCDLYLYDAGNLPGERLTQVTAGSNGQVAPIVVQVSGDGSHAYFTSTEALAATPGPAGGLPQAGQPNLYVYQAESGELSFVGIAQPESSWPVPVYGANPSQPESSGDGHKLAFTTKLPVTADDLDGGKADVFLYDADAHQIVRISKASAGIGDNGPHDAITAISMGGGEGRGDNDPSDPDIGVRGRWVSEDGKTIAFKTSERLIAADANQVTDSYLWRDGELSVIPGTEDSGAGLFDQPLVSVSGGTVAFQSFEQLLPGDGDTAADVYALRVNGGFAVPAEPAVCVPGVGGGCQGDIPASPGAVAPPSSVPRGSGNKSPRTGPDCKSIDRRASVLGKKAQQLRQKAARAETAKAKRGLSRRATRAAKQAERERERAKQCTSNGQGGSR